MWANDYAFLRDAYQARNFQKESSKSVINEYNTQYVSHCWSSSVEGLSIALIDANLDIGFDIKEEIDKGLLVLIDIKSQDS